MDISVVIPVYNEEDNVALLYHSVKGVMERLEKDYEILYVDDGSTDSTFERLCRIRQDDKNVKIVGFKGNYGQTSAMQAGFDYAKGEWIITMDGDLQNDPEDIPRLLKGLEDGYDVVCGWRKDRKDKMISRKIPSKIANALISFITGVKIHDNGCSLKAYRAAVIKEVSFYSDMHRFIPAMSTLVGATITEIEVNHRPREHGASKYGLNRVWKVFLDIFVIKMITSFASRPALLFGLMGLPFLVLGIIALATLTILYIYNMAGQWIVIPAVTFLFFALFAYLLTVGVVGELCVKTGNHSPVKGLKSTIKAL